MAIKEEIMPKIEYYESMYENILWLKIKLKINGSKWCNLAQQAKILKVASNPMAQHRALQHESVRI